jgi:Histidine kinase
MDASDTVAPNLTQALPPEVAQGEFGSGWYYERFAPFSWHWTLRRTLLFGAVLVPFGAMFGVIHGLFAHSLAEGIAVGWRAAVTALLVVSTGPVLASLVRHAGLRPRVEHLGVVLAIVAGVLLSWSLRVYVETYHDHLMGMTVTSAQRWLDVFSGRWPMHAVIENLTDLIAALTVHGIGSGALALRSYFDEPRRWRAYAARRELDALRQQKLAAEARLSVLQAQVEPHFLFNTLASVSAEIEADPHRAKDLVQALAQYLRSTLPRMRQEGPARAATLAEQFELCSRYLDIMALRLGARFSMTVGLSAELGRLPFPPLLLFSLVENAVTHGVEPKAGAARIALSARLTEAAGEPVLEVRVEDDGAGLREGLVEGTGISNVRSQLATLYGPAARFSIESPAGHGVRATIAIALRALQS